MSNNEVTTATINKSTVVHYVYTIIDGFDRPQTFSLCNGERMGYQRIARPTKDADTCKRCLKAHR
jgi:hypothetical protein